MIHIRTVKSVLTVLGGLLFSGMILFGATVVFDLDEDWQDLPASPPIPGVGPLRETQTVPDDVSEQIKNLQNAINNAPRNMDPYLSLGSLLLRDNRPGEAVDAYWWVARHQLQNLEALDGLGSALLTVGDSSNAAAVYKKLTALAPDNNDFRFNLAAAYHRLQRYEDAIAELTVFLEHAPQHPKAFYNLAIATLALGDTDKAISLLEESYAAQPDNPFALCAIARIYARGNSEKQMLATLQRAAKLMSPEQLNIILRHHVFHPWYKNGLFDSLLENTPEPSSD